MREHLQIGHRAIGQDKPVLIIAEAGVNHNGDRDLAFRLVDAARAAGADAVKFQTFRAERLVSPRAQKARYQKENDPRGESQLEMLRALELAEGVFRILAQYAAEKGLLFLSTPFDDASLEILRAMDVPAYKIGSGDVTNTPFLTQAARIGKPIILSTGMSTLGEVEQAVAAVEQGGNRQLVLLQCTSAYPTPVEDVNLRAMVTLQAFGYPVGFSDHTTGTTAGVAAAALGATVIEKHLTLDHSLPGPDHKASLDPDEFARYVREIRDTEKLLGSSRKAPTPSEEENRRLARKSLVAAGPIKAGTVIVREMLAAKRPGDGLPPAILEQLVGMVALRDIDKDEPITWQDVAPQGERP